MNILWIQPSGQLALTSVFDDMSPPGFAELHAAVLRERGDIPADWQLAAINVDWPETGWRHEAHRWDGGKVVVDLEAAKEETRIRLRAEREPLFAANDLRLRDALIDGDEAKRLAGIAERDRLRGITDLVDSAMSLDSLKALSAEVRDA